MKNLFDRIEKSTLNTPKPFVVKKESQKPQEAVVEEIRTVSRRSLLYFLTLVKSAGGVHDLFEGAAQEYVLEDGAAAIVNSIEEDIKKDVNIVLDQAVNTIEASGGRRGGDQES